MLVPGGGGVPQRRQRVFDGGGGERDVRREHDGYVSGSWSIVRRVVCDPRRGQGHSVSGGAAERVRVAGDEQLDGGASAMQRVHDGLRVAHVRSDGRVERA